MKKIALAAALLGSMIAAPALAATVENGSFETPTVGSPTYNAPGTMDGAGFEPNGGAFGYAAAPDGNQILHLQGLGSATLSLSDLIVGQGYTVSFFAAARPGYPALPVSVSYNNTLLGTFAPTSTAFTQFTGFDFIAAATTGTLTFAGLNAAASAANDQNTGVDAVTVAPVPEPATWGMMILGFGMLGFGLRRRNAKVATKISFA